MAKKAKTNLLTKVDLDKIAGLLDAQFDNRLKPFVEEFVGERVNSLETSLKAYIHEGVETIMDGMDNLAKELTEREKVERIAKAVKEIGEKVGIKVDI
ncbi:MAG: hypothetical protein HY545_02655 [Candidatus Doudnabacteria bacterium]|nr:hypothetical protein [Candidatus Doudnabacteria bacterium]